VCSLVVIFHKSTSIGTLKQLLVYDLMRSFYARINLLVEDLDARKDIIGDEQLDDPDCTVKLNLNINSLFLLIYSTNLLS